MASTWKFIHSLSEKKKVKEKEMHESKVIDNIRALAHTPLRRLPLSRNHQRLRQQWARERCHWHAEWQNVVFSDESRFNMSYNDSRIRVRCYAGERNLRACILQQHRGPTPSVMVWGTIGYNMQSHLQHIEDNLNRNHYIREVLQPEVLPLLQATPHAIFQQDNARPRMARIVQAFFNDDGYHCFPGLHVRQTCRPSNMSGIWLLCDLFVRVLQHLLLTLCGLSCKLSWGTFPRKISRASLIPCHDA